MVGMQFRSLVASFNDIKKDFHDFAKNRMHFTLERCNVHTVLLLETRATDNAHEQVLSTF